MNSASESRRPLFLPALLALAVSAAALLSGGCRDPYDAFPEDHPQPWTPGEIELMLGGDDPMEGFNRAMFSCTDFLMSYVADPLGRVYTSIFPRPFIRHFNNVCVNLEYPARAVSSLLQAEWRAAGTESVRFLANTTLGIAGIFDVAESWWDIPPADADFGQAFASWGIGPGETFMIPVAPTLNGRDLIGLLFDTAFDLKTYIPYAGYATFLNRMVVMQDGYSGVVDNAADPYKNFRQLMLVRRELQLRMWLYRERMRLRDEKRAQAERQADTADGEKPVAEAAERAKTGETGPAALPPEAPPRPAWLKYGNYVPLTRYRSQGFETDSMRVTLFQVQRDRDWWYMPLSIFNGDFRRAGYLRSVEISENRPKLRYGFWKAPEPAEDAGNAAEKLAVMLPGIGGTYTESTLLALAEQFNLAGFKVLTLDSTFNWRSAVTDDKLRLPGYLPDDAAKVREAIVSVLADLKERGWITAPEIVICGYSMGGIQTLKLAEMEEKEEIIGVRRFIAVNPPASLGSALDKIDSMVSASAGWSKSEMRGRLVDSAGRMVMKLAPHYGHLTDDMSDEEAEKFTLPTDAESSRVIAGIFMKMSMREMLFAIHRERPLADCPPYSWGGRDELYRRLDEITFRDYAEKLVTPQYPDKTVEELLEMSSLAALEETLRTSPKVRVLHNIDDFLVNDGERVWMDEVLRDRLTWFSNGGHLGNLYYRKVLDAVIRAAE